LEDRLDKAYSDIATYRKIVMLFSILAVFIACMGLLGLTAYMNRLRIKEIGIRKVNGASLAELLAMLMKDFAKWVVIALFLAIPLSWYLLNYWLQTFAYKTELSWWIFALAGLLALGIALLTVSFQSWKAATKNPVESLRYE
jgi:putative ABC transport system permease protein